MNGVNPVRRFVGAVTNSVSFRLAVICLLVMLLLIPASMVRSLIDDYALLMGSLGLLMILGFIMYRTRKIDWYGIRLNRDKQE